MYTWGQQSCPEPRDKSTVTRAALVSCQGRGTRKASPGSGGLSQGLQLPYMPVCCSRTQVTPDSGEKQLTLQAVPHPDRRTSEKISGAHFG